MSWRQISPPPLKPVVQGWGWDLERAARQLRTLRVSSTDALGGEKRSREEGNADDDSVAANAISEAELLLSISATVPLDDLSAMIERLLALDLEQLQPTRQERVRQLVARLQAAKRSRDAAATQLEEDLEDPATRAELMLQEARQRLRVGQYGNSEARQLADEMDALAAADPDAERAEELRALAARLRD